MDNSMDRMRFTELKCCPFCGNKEYYEKMKVSGISIYRSRFDGEEAENSEMYDGLYFNGSGRVYCSKCNRYLGNYQKDVVGLKAEHAARGSERNT